MALFSNSNKPVASSAANLVSPAEQPSQADDEEKEPWCCFWDTAYSNLLAICVHGLIGSAFNVAQCVGVYLFAATFSLTPYNPPRPDLSSPSPPKPGQDPAEAPQFVTVQLSPEQEELFRRIVAADWDFSGGLGVGGLEPMDDPMPIPPVLSPYERDIYIISSILMFAVNAVMFLASSLVLVTIRRPHRLILKAWMATTVFYVFCDVVYYVLLIYTLLNFERLDTTMATTWFHAMSSTYIIAVFVRISIFAYSFMFVLELVRNVGGWGLMLGQGRTSTEISDEDLNERQRTVSKSLRKTGSSRVRAPSRNENKLGIAAFFTAMVNNTTQIAGSTSNTNGNVVTSTASSNIKKPLVASTATSQQPLATIQPSSASQNPRNNQLPIVVGLPRSQIASNFVQQSNNNNIVQPMARPIELTSMAPDDGSRVASSYQNETYDSRQPRTVEFADQPLVFNFNKSHLRPSPANINNNNEDQTGGRRRRLLPSIPPTIRQLPYENDQL